MTVSDHKLEDVCLSNLQLNQFGSYLRYCPPRRSALFAGQHVDLLTIGTQAQTIIKPTLAHRIGSPFIRHGPSKTEPFY